MNEQLPPLDDNVVEIVNTVLACERDGCSRIAKYRIGWKYLCRNHASKETVGYNKPLSELVNQPAP